MDSKQNTLKVIKEFERLLEKQTGKAIRPYRADGYVNVLNRYGTNKDTTENYHYQAEPVIPDDMLTSYYESNGLFAKIIDSPAEEAVKHGFTLNVNDQTIEDFYTAALDELDWEETCMTAIKWTRLFGGCIVVMLINDGRGIDEPLDWKNIRSIDDLRIYDRSLIQEDISGMFDYRPDDPFRTRASRLGMPEYYNVYSRYGSFRVHDSRCLVFQNGTLPENTSNSNYQMWGIPEYVKLHRAIRDAEVAHGSAVKLLDRSIQPVYKMKDLAAELATEQGEERILRRLQTIDMARGLLNSITIDSEGEDYDFKTFQFTGVSDVIDSTCNYLSALTCIPQTILFGRSPSGMNATGVSDLENWYNYLERIQSRMIKRNLRYLLSVIFQAGVACNEIDEVPDINIEFNPLWSMSESEKISADQQKAAIQQAKAQTAQLYMDAGVIDPSEVRKKLADSEEFDIENMLDEYDEEDLFANMPQNNEQMMMEGSEQMMSGASPQIGQTSQAGHILTQGDFSEYAEGVNVEEHNTDPGTENSSPTAAPAATKLPQDMSEEEKAKAVNKDGGPGSGNWGHEGRPGEVGGSAPESNSNSGGSSHHNLNAKELKSLSIGSKIRSSSGTTYTVTIDEYGERWLEGDDGSSYSLDIPLEVHSFIRKTKGNIQETNGNKPDTRTSQKKLGELKESFENAYSADTPQDFDDMYRDQTGEIWKSLDNDTKGVLADYSGHTYYEINKALRDGDTSNYSDEVNKITDTINKSELVEDTVLYRGVDVKSFEKLMGMEAGTLSTENVSQVVGSVGKENGFMSTSSTKDGVYFKGSSVQMEVLAPAGTKALYAEPFAAYNNNGGRKWNGESGQSEFSSEDETIVQRGSSLTVLSGEYDTAKNCYHFKVAITDQDDRINKDRRTDGGPGSGNFGHEGRPGKVGGSAPDGGQTGGSSENTKKTSSMKARASQLQNRLSEISNVSKSMLERLMSEGITQELVQEQAALKREREELEKELNDINQELDTYSSKHLAEEGHLTQSQIKESLPKEWRDTYSLEQGQTMWEAASANVIAWTGEGYKELKDDLYIDDMIKKSSAKWSGGDLYRGMSIPEDTLSSIKENGVVRMQGLSSWSSDVSPAMDFATCEQHPVLIIDKTKGTRNALGIAQMSGSKWEKEVIYGAYQEFSVKSVQDKQVKYKTSAPGKSGYDRSLELNGKVTVIEVEAI